MKKKSKSQRKCNMKSKVRIIDLMHFIIASFGLRFEESIEKFGIKN